MQLRDCLIEMVILQRSYLQQYCTQTHHCCRKYSVRNYTNRTKYSKLSSEAELYCGSSGKEIRQEFH